MMALVCFNVFHQASESHLREVPRYILSLCSGLARARRTEAMAARAVKVGVEMTIILK
jgi:hypothetical protein